MGQPLREKEIQILLDASIEWITKQEDVLEQQFAEMFLKTPGLAKWLAEQSTKAYYERVRCGEELG